MSTYKNAIDHLFSWLDRSNGSNPIVINAKQEVELMRAELKEAKRLITSLDGLNRLARKEGQGAWSLNDIYQERIDRALGVLPFAEPDPKPVSAAEMRSQGVG